MFINDKESKILLCRGCWNQFKKVMLIASLVNMIRNTKGTVTNGPHVVIFQICMTI